MYALLAAACERGSDRGGGQVGDDGERQQTRRDDQNGEGEAAEGGDDRS
jgi:hypothetical protein